MVPCAGPVFEELHAFLRVCVRLFRGETALQLLEVVIHHGEIKPLGGWQAVAFATRTLGGRLGHSTSTNSVNLFSLGQHTTNTTNTNTITPSSSATLIPHLCIYVCCVLQGSTYIGRLPFVQPFPLSGPG